MSVDLVSLGWDAGFAAAYTPYDRPDQYPARVARVDRGICTVLSAAGTARASLGGALVIDALRQKRRPPEPELDLDLDIEDATIIAQESGLSDVDPQPLTHTAGEGIVPGEDEEARENVQGVRDRLPTSRGR